MTYQEIKKQHSDAYNKIMSDAGVFWAFSTEQLKKGIKKANLKKGKKFVNIGAGGYMPSANLDKMLEDLKQATKIKTKQLKEAREEKASAILYELNNHECFYRGNGLDDVAEIFKGIYTEKDILKVYQKNLRGYKDTLVNNTNGD